MTTVLVKRGMTRPRAPVKNTAKSRKRRLISRVITSLTRMNQTARSSQRSWTRPAAAPTPPPNRRPRKNHLLHPNSAGAASFASWSPAAAAAAPSWRGLSRIPVRWSGDQKRKSEPRLLKRFYRMPRRPSRTKLRKNWSTLLTRCQAACRSKSLRHLFQQWKRIRQK